MPSPAKTKAEAIALGLDRYFTGKPCKRGHIAERRVRARLCLECVAEDHRNWAPASSRARNMKWRYGITIEEYNDLLSRQGNCCAMCGGAEIGRNWGSRFMIDHCHKTGRVRGLLCNSCNILLGHAKDDIGRLHAAIQYLRCEEVTISCPWPQTVVSNAPLT